MVFVCNANAQKANSSERGCILLINVTMPSNIYGQNKRAEHEKSFITSGPVLYYCLHASPPYMGVRVGGQSGNWYCDTSSIH